MSNSEKLKFTKLEQKAEKIETDLLQAKAKIPSRKIRIKERVFNEEKQRAETKLICEEESIPINEAKWNQPKKRSVPRKIAGTIKTVGINKLHSKVYEVEHENVGTEAAHKSELTAESMYHSGKNLAESAYRFVRNSPYRNVSRIETKSVKAQVDLAYHKAIQENPNLKSNALSRYIQKQRIKRNFREQYSAAAKAAKDTAQTAKTAGSFIRKMSSAVTGAIRKNPVIILKGGLLLLIIFAVMSLFSMCASLLSGSMQLMIYTAYTAEDIDINNAELLYTEMETDLLISIQSTETDYGGYDGYNYMIGSIGHDPFDLTAFLTAMYGAFTYDGIESVLRDIFNEQYTLEYEADANNILNVTLTVKPLGEIFETLMTDETVKAHYTLLTQTRGNRQYVGSPFDAEWYDHVTSGYGYRIHPISGNKDLHRGIDITLPEDTDILAGITGTVTESGYSSSYGNYVAICDGNGTEVKYAHCKILFVNVNQNVSAGDVIAKVGDTGDSTGFHLHMEVVKDGMYLNPLFYVLPVHLGIS